MSDMADYYLEQALMGVNAWDEEWDGARLMPKSQKGIPCPQRGHKPKKNHPWKYAHNGDGFYANHNKDKYKPKGEKNGT